MEACTNYTDFLPSQDHTNHLPGPSPITEANDTQDQGSTAYSELPISDTETESSYSLHPEDTNFSPLQDHIAHLPRPPCSPRLTRQHLRPCFNKSQQFMNTTYIKKTKPSCIPIPKDTKSTKNSHLSTSTDLQKPSCPTPPYTLTTAKQPTPPTPRTLQPLHTLNAQEKHHYYLHQQHQWDDSVKCQPFQDQYHTTDNSLQDHHHSLQDHHQSTTDFTSNGYHYYHHHHTRFQHFQDHTNRHQDTTHTKYLYHYMFPL